MKRQAKQQSGFTILELVVATGVFLILVLATTGIFASVLKAQRQAIALSKVEREAQLLLETIAKKIRTSRVDYDSYTTPIANPVSRLTLIDQEDTLVVFDHNDVTKAVDLSILVDNDFNPISRSDVTILDLDFFIEPTTNPFVSGLLPESQPRITVVMTLAAGVGLSQVDVTIQQTTLQLGGGY